MLELRCQKSEGCILLRAVTLLSTSVLTRGLATLAKVSDQERDGRPPGEHGLSKSMECDALTPWVGDRKGIHHHHRRVVRVDRCATPWPLAISDLYSVDSGRALASSWTLLSQTLQGPPSFRPVKMLGVGLLVATIWLELCTSYSSSCHHSPPPSSLAPVISRMETFRYQLTWVHLEELSLNEQSVSDASFKYTFNHLCTPCSNGFIAHLPMNTGS